MKYDIDKTIYNNSKAIGYYDFFTTNCISNYIEILDVKNGYENIIVYRAVCSIEDKMEKGKVRIAKINDANMTFNCYDIHKRRHCISFNQLLAS